MPGCDDPKALLANVTLLRCDETYTTASGKALPCGTGATCSNLPVFDHLALPTTTTCTCSDGNYPHTEAANPTLAPYLHTATGGCSLPLVAAPLVVVLDEALVSLSKSEPATARKSLNVTLRVHGSDYRAGHVYDWHVVAPEALPQWLEVPVRHGNVSHTSTEFVVLVLITISSATLPDGTNALAHLVVELRLQNVTEQDHQEVTLPVRALVKADPVASASLVFAGGAAATVRQQYFVRFSARDVDGLPVQYSGAPFTPSILFCGSNGCRALATDTIIWHISYDSGANYTLELRPFLVGNYIVRLTLGGELLLGQANTTTVCPHDKVQNGEVCSCDAGSFQEDDLCRSCVAGSYSPTVGGYGCLACKGAHVTSAARSRSVEDCVCAPSYFNDTGVAPGGQCRACPEGSRCDDAGGTMQSLNLSSGFWRLSNSTVSIWQCAEGTRPSRCAGGAEPGAYCLSGFTGPMCEVCTEPWHYFANDNCEKCAHHGVAANGLPIMYLVGGLASLALLLRFAWPYLSRRGVVGAIWSAVAMSSRLGVMPKAKLLLGYYQARTPYSPRSCPRTQSA